MWWAALPAAHVATAVPTIEQGSKPEGCITAEMQTSVYCLPRC
jgi:hypothetical protein